MCGRKLGEGEVCEVRSLAIESDEVKGAIKFYWKEKCRHDTVMLSTFVRLSVGWGIYFACLLCQ